MDFEDGVDEGDCDAACGSGSRSYDSVTRSHGRGPGEDSRKGSDASNRNGGCAQGCYSRGKTLVAHVAPRPAQHRRMVDGLRCLIVWR